MSAPATPSAQVWTVRELLNWTTDFLRKKGVESAAFESRLLMGHALKCSSIEVVTRYDEEPSDADRTAFRELVAGHVDILFANETEICSLYEANEFEDAATAVQRDVALAVLTRGADGSNILTPENRIEVDAAPATPVDTTGAGDAYAAGFLAALTSGRTLEACGRLGSVAAAAAIGQYGARPPMQDLRQLATG